MGLSASLAALRRITGDLTAVVTVADDGGSSGRLRDELGVLPPGDLRKALAALCGDDEWGQTWSRVIQHRFASERRPARPRGRQSADRRPVGAARRPRSPALEWVGRLLGAHGRVLPMSAVPLELQAIVRGHDPARPDEIDHGPRPGHRRADPRRGAAGACWCPSDPPAVPEAVAGGAGRRLGGARPRLLVLLGDPAPAGAGAGRGAGRRPGPAGCSRSTSRRSRAKPRAFLRSVIWRFWPDTPLNSPSTWCSPTRPPCPTATACAEAAERLAAATVELAPVGRPPDGPRRHDPELLAAAYDRIFRMHGRIGPWR